MAGVVFGKDHLTNGYQASLSDRFILDIEGVDIALIDGVTRPGYTIETEQFQLLEFQFNFPKTVKFDNTISFNIIELLDPDIELTTMQNIMSRLIDDSIYVTPTNLRDPKYPFIGQPKSVEGFGILNQGTTSTTFNLSKKSLTDAVSINTKSFITIHTLDSEGRKYDSIRLIGPMITKVKPSSLKYGSSDLNKVEVTITFDYADFGREDVYNVGGVYDKFKSRFPKLSNLLNVKVNKRINNI
jgi:hypothetical protein